MAWTTITPFPKGSGNITGGSVPGYFNFATYRNFKGTIEGRLHDVTFDSGYQFHYFYLWLELVNSAGTVRARGALGKYWGVPPGFTGLGTVNPGGELLRFRVTSANDSPKNVAGAWYTATYEIRFNSSLV